MTDGSAMIDILIAWFPMLLLIGVWVYLARAGNSIYRGVSGKSHGQMLEESVEEQRRMNALLEKLLADHEGRIQRLEQRLGGTSR